MSWWERFRKWFQDMDPEYDPQTGTYAGELLWKAKPKCPDSEPTSSQKS